MSENEFSAQDLIRETQQAHVQPESQELVTEDNETDKDVVDSSVVETTSYQTGSMPPQLSKVIVRLMKHGFLYQYHEPCEELFNYAANAFKDIELFFRDFGLIAHYSVQNKLIYLKLHTDSLEDIDDVPAASLTHRKFYNKVQTVVMLYLRRRVIERRDLGETRVYVDINDIKTGATPLLPENNSDTKTNDKISEAVKKLIEAGILLKQKGHQDFFEISPLLQLELSIPRLDQLIKTYQEELQGDE
ncbi:hypothetical protein A3715_17360 [Oleiphilus sp. HI0009]|nr:hypothetical protein A3715_17360 [Oleiphilus sp. HI0009]